MSNIRLCPSCGAGKITEVSTGDVSIDPDVECTSCGWKGQGHELMAAITPRSTSIDPHLAVAEEISRMYLQLLAKEAAKIMGVAMIQSGVIGGREDPKILGRLVRAACLGAHRATLEEIENIQTEKSHGTGN